MVNKYSLRVVRRSHTRPSCFKGECNVETSLIDNANQYYKVSLYEHTADHSMAQQGRDTEH